PTRPRPTSTPPPAPRAPSTIAHRHHRRSDRQYECGSHARAKSRLALRSTSLPSTPGVANPLARPRQPRQQSAQRRRTSPDARIVAIWDHELSAGGASKAVVGGKASRALMAGSRLDDGVPRLSLPEPRGACSTARRQLTRRRDRVLANLKSGSHAVTPPRATDQK